GAALVGLPIRSGERRSIMNRRFVALLAPGLFLTCWGASQPPQAQGVAAQPPTGAKNPPSLRVEDAHRHAFGKVGEVRVWTLTGQGVKALTAYLLVFTDGKAERIDEGRCTWDGASPPLSAQLAF